MHFLRRFFALSAIVCITFMLMSCPPRPLRLLSIDPNLSDYRVTGDEAIVATFDQPVDSGTVSPASFFVTEGEDAAAPHVAGSLAVSANRITFDPYLKLKFGVRHRVRITQDVKGEAGEPFDGFFPQTTYGNTAVPAPGDIVVVTLPDDLDDHEIGSSFELLGYDPLLPAIYNPEVPETCPGISATEAWKFTTGRPDVLVAVIDNGLGNYASSDLQRSLFINRGELPLPRNAQGDSVCDLGPCDDPYDWNGDGRFNVFDYAGAGYAIDPSGTLLPFTDVNGNGRRDVGDLIELYPDEADGYAADPDAPDDLNDFADDISGYDFMRKVPSALGMDDFPEGTHGEGRSKEVAAEGDNGSGTPGVCPDCTVLAMRITYALIEEGELVAQAIRYALGLGADVIVAALGALTGTSEEVLAIEEANALGVPIITGPGDESSFHHSYPSVMNHVFTVKGNYGYFIESYCTGYGGQIHTSAVGNCGSTASGRAAGATALVVARARELGYCAASDPGNPECTRPDLGSNEVKQILCETADKSSSADACFGLLTSAPCKLDTWDMHQGYGRINLFKAMVRLEQWPPPPAVEILEPGWFQYFDPEADSTATIAGTASTREPVDAILCEYAPGIEPDEIDFSPFACSLDGEDFSGDLDLYEVMASIGGAGGPPEDPEARSFTVRVSATAAGARGEDRRVFAVHIDPDLMEGFPFSLADLDGDGLEEVLPGASNAPSIESSPALADLDGDGADELILATSNSFLHVLSYDAGLGRVSELPGYPIPIRRLPEQNDGIAGAPAVGDIDLDGSPDIVIATLSGYAFAFRGIDGAPLAVADGLIGQSDTPPNDSPESWGAGNHFLSSPVLADLDGDGDLDIVVGCSDQKVYAFSGASIAAGAPERLAGWPVLTADPADCDTLANSVLGTVAAVDVTGDGTAEIIAGTSETCHEPMDAAGRLYAIHPDGNLHPGGPYVQGFPVGIDPNFLGIEIPLPPLTTGIPGAPVAAGCGDEVVIGTSTFLGPITYVRVDTTTGEVTQDKLLTILLYGAGASGAFGTDASGETIYAVGTATVGLAEAHGLAQIEHRTITAKVEGALFATIYENDDFMLMTNPLFVDVDGDGTPELLTVSGGHLIHAFIDPATEVEGWPKFTYGWHMASPAVGDIDGDGLVEVIAPVREGRIFAWRTAGPVGGNHPWPTYHHDNYRTGFLDGS